MRNFYSKNRLNTFKYFSTTRQEKIIHIMKSSFNPIHLEVINESYKHSVPKDYETHFKIIIVSEDFKQKSQIKIHQEIYKQLQSEMGEKFENKLHAVSIVSKTPEEWEKITQSKQAEEEFKDKTKSPNCMGNRNQNI